MNPIFEVSGPIGRSWAPSGSFATTVPFAATSVPPGVTPGVGPVDVGAGAETFAGATSAAGLPQPAAPNNPGRMTSETEAIRRMAFLMLRLPGMVGFEKMGSPPVHQAGPAGPRLLVSRPDRFPPATRS